MLVTDHEVLFGEYITRQVDELREQQRLLVAETQANRIFKHECSQR